MKTKRILTALLLCALLLGSVPALAADGPLTIQYLGAAKLCPGGRIDANN